MLLGGELHWISSGQRSSVLSIPVVVSKRESELQVCKFEPKHRSLPCRFRIAWIKATLICSLDRESIRKLLWEER